MIRIIGLFSACIGSALFWQFLLFVRMANPPVINTAITGVVGVALVVIGVYVNLRKKQSTTSRKQSQIVG